MQRGRQRKFDWDLMEQLLSDGKSTKEVSEQFGVNNKSVWTAHQKMTKKKQMVSTVVFEKGREMVHREMDVMGQLVKTNENLNSVLDLVVKAIKGDQTAIDLLNKDSRCRRSDPVLVFVRLAGEIREGVAAFTKIQESIFTLRQTQEFNEEVLAELETFKPGVRKAILQRLQEKRLMSKALEWKEKR